MMARSSACRAIVGYTSMANMRGPVPDSSQVLISIPRSAVCGHGQSTQTQGAAQHGRRVGSLVFLVHLHSPVHRIMLVATLIGFISLCLLAGGRKLLLLIFAE